MVIAKLNRVIIGWANYFCLGPVSKAYGAVTNHACKRLCQWLCAKHKVLGSRTNRFRASYLHHQLGLVCLTKRTSSFPWATSCPPFLREPDAANPHVRFDERGVETEAWWRS